MREPSPTRPFLWKCRLDKAVDDVRLAFSKHTLDNGQFRCQTNITPTVSDLNPKGKQTFSDRRIACGNHNQNELGDVFRVSTV